MNNIIGAVKKIDNYFGYLLRWTSIIMLLLMLVLLTINVFIRFVPIVSMPWFDEIIEMLFAWMVFIGAAALWRENEHFTLTFLPNALEGKKSWYVLNIIINLISLAFLFMFMYYSFELTARANDWTSVLRLPKRLLYACMPLGGAIMVLYTLRNILQSMISLFSNPAAKQDISKGCNV